MTIFKSRIATLLIAGIFSCITIWAATNTPPIETAQATTNNLPEETEVTVTNSTTDTTIIVTATKLDKSAWSNTHVKYDEIRRASGPGSSSPFKAIEQLPSVNAQSADPYGLSEAGFHETLKIRGVGQSGPASSRNINGLPLALNPGGSKGILDMENVDQVTLWRGIGPVNRTLGFSNLPGKIELTTKPPATDLESRLNLTMGSDNFRRIYVRQDSGKYGPLSAFGSGSLSEGDKWKGRGNFERQNLFFGITMDDDERWQTEWYGGFNRDKRYNYRFFDYETVKKSSNYRKDWSRDPSQVDYYKYNRQEFKDGFIYGKLRGQVSDSLYLTLKPYYLHESGNYRFSSINQKAPQKSRVVDWTINHDNMGAVTQVEWQRNEDEELLVGLWVQRQEPPGPPTTQRKYVASKDGLIFDGWQTLAKVEPHHLISPFVSWQGNYDPFYIEAGIRQATLRLGKITAYNNSGVADHIYGISSARSASAKNETASANARTLTEWLPSLAMGWDFLPDTTLFTRMGRTYGLDVNLFPYYYAQQQNFEKKGIDFETLWDRLKLETADQIDLGIGHYQDRWQLSATSFYAYHRHKQSTIYDPSVDVRYPWNGASAQRYGIELEGAAELAKGLRLFSNYCWNRFEYNKK